MTQYIDTIIHWFYALTPTEVVALILAALGISFAFAVAKAAVKAGSAVVAFLAVLYLVEPNLYSYSIDLIRQIYNSIIAWF